MKIFLMLCLMIGVTNVPPHKDTIIELKKDGTLVGLPKKYSPAHFDRSELILSVANNSIDLPDCVTKHFANMEDPTFFFSASWYHNKRVVEGYIPLPDYLSLTVSSQEGQLKVHILFNLEKLEIIKFYIVEKSASAKHSREPDISGPCGEEILNSITKK